MSHAQKRLFRVLIVVIATVVGAICISLIVLWTTFDTEQSKWFTKQGWSKVVVGMPEAEITSLLGEPLSRVLWTDRDTTTLNYSKSRSNNGNYIHYHITIRYGRVVDKRREIFWD